jgi:hypothetical protein
VLWGGFDACDAGHRPMDPDAATRDRIVRWARDFWDAVTPFSCCGVYVNSLREEGQDRVRAAYALNQNSSP